MKIIVVLLGLIVAYFSQTIVYSSGIINQLLMVIIYLINIVYWIKVIKFKNKILLVNAISIFCLFNGIGFFVAFFFQDNQDSVNFLKTVMFCLLSFFPFYYAGITGKNIKLPLFVFVISFLILSHFIFKIHNLQLMYDYDKEDIVNNHGYNFILLLPLLILTDKRNVVLHLIIVAIIIYHVAMSAKRGALVCCGGGILTYLAYQYKNMRNRQSWKSNLMFIIFAIAVTWLLYHSVYSNDFFMRRWNDVAHNTSGRDEILTTLYTYWDHNSTFFSLLFGFGMASTFMTGGYAHNDYVEFLFDYGLIGFSVYCGILYLIFKEISSKNINRNIKYTLITILIIWVLKGFTTGVLTGDNSLLLTIPLGYACGLKHYTASAGMKNN
jgi:O-antigen ligase